MRVLSIGSMYPPHHEGGYELVWQSATAHLRAAGHEVTVLTTDHRQPGVTAPDEEGVHRELRWYWRDHDFPRLPARERIRVERHNAEVVRRHLDAGRPDVVAWWAMGGMSLALIGLVGRSGVPAAAFVHDDWLVYGPHVDRWSRLARRAPWLKRVVGLPAGFAEADVARWAFVSRNVRDRARREGYALPEAGIAPSGIDAAFLDGATEPGPWRGRLLSLGRIDPRKGVDTAIDALAAAEPDAGAGEGGGPSLTIVGEGDERHLAELRERARVRGVADRVDFAGARPRDELPAIIDAHDAVVFPVRWREPWGLVPLEAMARRRPVLATGRGGSGEFLEDGVNALLFPPDDHAALAAATARLATDPALRARLAEAGAATAARHTEPIFNARVEAILRELAG